MTRTLKQARHDLNTLLAESLGVAVAPYGKAANPPCVMTRPASTYVENTGYCSDKVYLEAVVLPGPGEGEANVDALDDLIDKIRTALNTPFSDGFKFSFFTVRMLDGDEPFGAAVEITYERNDD